MYNYKRVTGKVDSNSLGVIKWDRQVGVQLITDKQEKVVRNFGRPSPTCLNILHAGLLQ